MLEAVIIYSSIFLGKLLYAIAKEEIKEWKRYITSAKNLLIIFISLTLIYLSPEFKMVISIIIGFILFSFLKNMYLLIGLSALLSIFTASTIILSSLILLLSLIYSSLSKFKMKEVIFATLYFALPFILISLETFIKANFSIFSGLAVGGLLAQLRARSSAW
ncbi:hypothetical protein HYV89_02445 [Candidatus Woesearchaeota archaeon]|nr:hypothetical protein [Candidatus Woesearchaeota archaeon]